MTPALEPVGPLAQDFLTEEDTLAEEQRWGTVLNEIYARALQVLPDKEHLLEKARSIVTSGGVEHGETKGTWLVHSTSTPHKVYTVKKKCPCDGAASLPDGMCCHRLASMLYQRTYVQFHALETSREAPAAAPAAASAAANTPLTEEEKELLRPYLVDIHGTPAVRVAGLLILARKRGLVSLSAQWTYNEKELSLATATAVFRDGSTYTESGDATPSNCNKNVAPHFRRVALTRAKGRALRDACGIDTVTAEELGD